MPFGDGYFTDAHASDGRLMLAPGIRYTWQGMMGIELSGLLPVTGPFGKDYPATVLIEIVGGGILFFGLAKHLR